jgi:hypothetical protein
VNPRPTLRRDHPTATAFLDETGSISRDRFFAVGLVKLTEPARLLRQIQRFRDTEHWYKEIRFTDVTKRSLGTYRKVVDLLSLCEGRDNDNPRFFCFVADRDRADPVARFGTQWDAYGKLAEQLVTAVIRPDELLTVMADNYSTPNHVLFEEDLRAAVNRRLQRLSIVSVCRLDSRSCDGLQIADLLTSAIAFEFREHAGLASSSNPKAQLAAHVRDALGTSTCLAGWRNASHSVAVYEHGSWRPSGKPQGLSGDNR